MALTSHFAARTLAAAVGALMLFAPGSGHAQQQQTQPAQQQPQLEVFRAPPNDPGLLRNWDGDPYIGLIGMCGGISEAYQDLIVTHGGEKQEVATIRSFVGLVRLLMQEHLAQHPYINQEDVVRNWASGRETALAAVNQNKPRGMVQVNNTVKGCIAAIRYQEQRTGRDPNRFNRQQQQQQQ